MQIYLTALVIRTGFKMMRKLGRYIGKMVGEQALQLLSDA